MWYPMRRTRKEIEEDSPCIGTCTLNEDNVCIGCWRHISEIIETGKAMYDDND